MIRRASFTTAAMLAAGAALLAFVPASASQSGKPATSNSGRIAIGDGVDGRISRSNATYTVQGRAGQRLRAALSSDDFDTVLRLRGPGGFEVENDDAGGSLNSLVDAVLPVDGAYSLTVSSFNNEGSGAFRLGTMDPARPVGGIAPAIVLGQSLTGALTRSDATALSGEYVDYYAFTGRRGQAVTFDLGSDSIDTLLSVYLPDGRVESNDDLSAGENTNSRLSITLPADGTYHVAASSFGRGMTGPYAVRLSETAAGVRTVRPAGGQAQVYALTIGVADYERMSTLSRTDEDATRIAAALRNQGILAEGSANLVNADATRANVRRALDRMAAAMGPDDLLMVFYSGHGDKVEGMTTERDGSAETMELFDAALYDYELADWMADIEGRVLLVMDSCFSGGFDQIVDARDERMGVFSSDADTLSLVATENKAGGYISAIFRAALEGEADLDRDAALTAGELSEFMRMRFYRTILDNPLATDAQDFRDAMTPGWQHIVIDRGGDGMAHGQVLMTLGGGPRQVARAN
ncbi:pre-peptidase C-terminal domain-containing protein [Aurantiacibacter arachoides]|nr:pre-peptidase C-terminal domain-containing protein [Aurantiacibacter arachoides]